MPDPDDRDPGQLPDPVVGGSGEERDAAGRSCGHIAASQVERRADRADHRDHDESCDQEQTHDPQLCKGLEVERVRVLAEEPVERVVLQPP